MLSRCFDWAGILASFDEVSLDWAWAELMNVVSDAMALTSDDSMPARMFLSCVSRLVSVGWLDDEFAARRLRPIRMRLYSTIEASIPSLSMPTLVGSTSLAWAGLRR